MGLTESDLNTGFLFHLSLEPVGIMRKKAFYEIGDFSLYCLLACKTQDWDIKNFFKIEI